MGRTACTEPQYSYTSTLPMGRTACTEPQCLYKGDLYLFTLNKRQVVVLDGILRCTLLNLLETKWNSLDKITT